MRSSKSRSRSKNNRNRSVGNVVNRVFDSSGPEGKVRGTPQQIIDKYLQLAQDSTLSNDRVAAENFQQHAEHYQRLLTVAQKEQEVRREQQEREQRDRFNQRDDQRRDRLDRQEAETGLPGGGEQPDVAAPAEDDALGLVETPEQTQAAQPARRPRKPRSSPARQEQPAPSGDDPAEAAE